MSRSVRSDEIGHFSAEVFTRDEDGTTFFVVVRREKPESYFFMSGLIRGETRLQGRRALDAANEGTDKKSRRRDAGGIVLAIQIDRRDPTTLGGAL